MSTGYRSAGPHTWLAVETPAATHGKVDAHRALPRLHPAVPPFPEPLRSVDRKRVAWIRESEPPLLPVRREIEVRVLRPEDLRREHRRHRSRPQVGAGPGEGGHATSRPDEPLVGAVGEGGVELHGGVHRQQADRARWVSVDTAPPGMGALRQEPVGLERAEGAERPGSEGGLAAHLQQAHIALHLAAGVRDRSRIEPLRLKGRGKQDGKSAGERARSPAPGRSGRS
jgi:hypothetical protein